MPDAFEVPEPILNSPFVEPAEPWHIEEGKMPERRRGRRSAVYYYRDPKVKAENGQSGAGGVAVEMPLVNLIRERVKTWRKDGFPGVTRITSELLQWWVREGRDERKRLFFAQREAAETIIFLFEARADYLQGISVPMDEASDDRKEEGIPPFAAMAARWPRGRGEDQRGGR